MIKVAYVLGGLAWLAVSALVLAICKAAKRADELQEEEANRLAEAVIAAGQVH